MSKNDDLDAVLRQLQAKGTQTAKPGVPNPLLHGGKDPHTDGGPTADKAPFTLASRPTGPVPTRDPDDAAKTTELEITSLEPRLPRFVSPPESPPPVPRSVARNASTTADQDDERTRQIELPTGSDVPVNLDTADAVEIPPDVVKAPRPPPGQYPLPQVYAEHLRLRLQGRRARRAMLPSAGNRGPSKMIIASKRKSSARLKPWLPRSRDK